MLLNMLVDAHFARISGEVRAFDPSRDMAALGVKADRIGNVHLIIVDVR